MVHLGWRRLRVGECLERPSVSFTRCDVWFDFSATKALNEHLLTGVLSESIFGCDPHDSLRTSFHGYPVRVRLVERFAQMMHKTQHVQRMNSLRMLV